MYTHTYTHAYIERTLWERAQEKHGFQHALLTYILRTKNKEARDSNYILCLSKLDLSLDHLNLFSF